MSHDFRSTATIEVLKRRAELLRITREFFDSRGFFEVQTPLLSADTVVDRHLDPIPVALPTDPFGQSPGRPMWLQTSPEFAMKRLLASGADAIYQITPAFRIGESGDQHNPEFTMLEWYRIGDGMNEGMQLLADFVTETLDTSEATTKSIGASFEELAGFNPMTMSCAELREQCRQADVGIPESLEADDWDTWFDLLFTELLQPKLGVRSPAIVHDYPASQAALAKIRTGHPDVAERFELFLNGVELANGYHELLDADELVRRNIEVNQQRAGDRKPPLPNESRLLDAMKHGLPSCSGVALGFDRLVMLAIEAKSIKDVIPFPIDRA